MEEKPHCILVMGMAGSGKTTFVRRLLSVLSMLNKSCYAINLDPAIRALGFPANLDICDTINYKKLMQEYALGPNGAIVTALNLFATKFHEVIDLLQSKKGVDYIVIDTPGQIETFSWSASGTIITEALASVYPTSVLYIVDAVRSANPNTFMSNMLYASSMYYKNKLPIVVAFNKIDIQPAEEMMNWMVDFESYMEKLDGICEKSYLANLNRSLALVLDEFYQDLPCVGVSAATGFGFDSLLPSLRKSREEYVSTYLPELEEKRKKIEENRVRENVERMKEDVEDLSQVRELMKKLNTEDKNN
jgi:GPN-loop GTPase